MGDDQEGRRNLDDISKYREIRLGKEGSEKNLLVKWNFPLDVDPSPVVGALSDPWVDIEGKKVTPSPAVRWKEKTKDSNRTPPLSSMPICLYTPLSLLLPFFIHWRCLLCTLANHLQKHNDPRRFQKAGNDNSTAYLVLNINFFPHSSLKQHSSVYHCNAHFLNNTHRPITAMHTF